MNICWMFKILWIRIKMAQDGRVYFHFFRWAKPSAESSWTQIQSSLVNRLNEKTIKLTQLSGLVPGPLWFLQQYGVKGWSLEAWEEERQPEAKPREAMAVRLFRRVSSHLARLPRSLLPSVSLENPFAQAPPAATPSPPYFSFGASMELMAVPKKKVDPAIVFLLRVSF